MKVAPSSVYTATRSSAANVVLTVPLTKRPAEASAVFQSAFAVLVLLSLVMDVNCTVCVGEVAST
jgi:hypothetical protein